MLKSFCKLLDNTEHEVQSPFRFFTVTNRSWGRALSQVDFQYFHIVASRDTFHASSVYSAVQWGKQTRIQSLLAYELFIN